MAVDIEDRLQSRRAEILVALENRSFVTSADPHTQRLHQEMLNELASIEQTLAQRQATKAQEIENARHAEELAARDDATFWFRRFILSLQIGNGAAFVGIVSGVLQTGDLRAGAGLLFWPATAFGAGLILSGLVPLLLWVERKSPQLKFDGAAGVNAVGAAICFAVGVFVMVSELDRLRQAPLQAATTPPTASAQSRASRPQRTPSSPPNHQAMPSAARADAQP